LDTRDTRARTLRIASAGLIDRLLDDFSGTVHQVGQAHGVGVRVLRNLRRFLCLLLRLRWFRLRRFLRPASGTILLRRVSSRWFRLRIGTGAVGDHILRSDYRWWSLWRWRRRGSGRRRRPRLRLRWGTGGLD